MEWCLIAVYSRSRHRSPYAAFQNATVPAALTISDGASLSNASWIIALTSMTRGRALSSSSLVLCQEKGKERKVRERNVFPPLLSAIYTRCSAASCRAEGRKWSAQSKQNNQSNTFRLREHWRYSWQAVLSIPKSSGHKLNEKFIQKGDLQKLLRWKSTMAPHRFSQDKVKWSCLGIQQSSRTSWWFQPAGDLDPAADPEPAQPASCSAGSSALSWTWTAYELHEVTSVSWWFKHIIKKEKKKRKKEEKVSTISRGNVLQQFVCIKMIQKS